MRPLRLLLLYLAVVFLGGALLAPWLYRLVEWGGGYSPKLAHLGAQPFHRYVNRSILVLALAGLRPLLRGLGIDTWSALGVTKPAGNWTRLALGFFLGFASLACVAVLAVTCGGRALKPDFTAGTVMGRLASASLTAVIVAMLEELLFRGALFGGLRKMHRWPIALLISSACYALVHFFQKPVSPALITWRSGLELLPRMLRGFADFETLVPGFFTLLLAGMILGMAFQRTGNLYLSIGLHAGWIFWLKFYGAMTLPIAQASQWFWGGGRLIDGWLALGILGPMLICFWLYPEHHRKTQRKKEPLPSAA